jgi:hypothetical protein
VWQGEYADTGARLYRTGDRQVLVVGRTSHADTVRMLFPYDGWRHSELSSPDTPIEALRPLVAPRLFNLLAREQICDTRGDRDRPRRHPARDPVHRRST